MRIKRYLKLFLEFFRFSFKADIEFRGNLIFYTIENILWLILAVVGINLIFGQIHSIAGWTKNEVFLVLFIGALFSDLSWTLIFRNLNKFSQLIREGTLDYYLLKPTNLRFLLSFRIIEFDHWIRIVLELFLIYKYTLLTSGYLSFLNILLFIFVFICGFIIFYSIFFAATITNIWFVKLENLVHLFQNIKNMGDRPVYIYKKGFLFFFSFILPIGYIATFPAQALMGEISTIKLIAGPILAIFLYWLSHRFFKFALKYYSSASS